MKKILAVTMAALAVTPIFCACSSERVATSTDVPSAVASRETVPTPIPEPPPIPEQKEIEIIFDGGFTFDRSPIAGVRRRFRGIDGTYTVEYIHTPYGIPADPTLDFNIELNADNTYGMTVVSNGVTSIHSGRWYARNDNITFFFDEQIDFPAHNEYIADALYAEILPHGKLMIYNNGHTVVLSKQTTDVITRTQAR